MGSTSPLTPTMNKEEFPPFDPGYREEEEREEREMFSLLQKPRVRYDVEVVTKLIVYSGASPSPIPVAV